MSTGWSLKRSWEAVEAGRADSVDAVYRAARSACPVVKVSDGDGPGFWAVLGHDLVQEVVADTATFSNVIPLYPTRRPPLESDPPEHTAYRRVLAAHFSSRRTAMMEPAIREFTREMLRPLLTAGEADFAKEFADPLPTRVLCYLLGIPDADQRGAQHDHEPARQRRPAPGARSSRAAAAAEHPGGHSRGDRGMPAPGGPAAGDAPGRHPRRRAGGLSHSRGRPRLAGIRRRQPGPQRIRPARRLPPGPSPQPAPGIRQGTAPVRRRTAGTAAGPGSPRGTARWHASHHADRTGHQVRLAALGRPRASRAPRATSPQRELTT